MGIINMVVKGVGSGIGMASEAIADHKEKKAEKQRGVSPVPAPALEAGESATERDLAHSGAASTADKAKAKGAGDEAHSDSDSSSIDSFDLNTDRADWALDDAAAELEHPPPTYDEASTEKPLSADEVTASFLSKVKATTPTPKATRPLPLPVILPQRRPKDKSRGFVRAYAPLLGECSGIDQQTFIDFLNDFDRASKASPVFNVINVACFAVGMVPNPIAMGVAISVQVASRTAQELQSRSRRNTYLDQVNESLFKPRGLYCMIMTFKPDMPDDAMLGVDVMARGLDASDQALLKATSTPDSELRQKLKNIRLTSGVSKGEVALPESAPLIYPALDAAAESALAGSAIPSKHQKTFQSSAGFMANYLDRRAQASYAGTHPESKLASPPPEKKFASRYSDPNHPANSGTILGLLTGGRFDPKAQKRGWKAQRRARRRGYELSEADIKNAEMGRLPQRKKGLIRRLMHKDVLYLTIVNLPSESEMNEMMQELERMQKR